MNPADGGTDSVFIAAKPYGHAIKKVLRTWRAISSAPPFHMTYIPAQDSSDGFAKVIYQSKDGNTSKTFDALDWSRQRRD